MVPNQTFQKVLGLERFGIGDGLPTNTLCAHCVHNLTGFDYKQLWLITTITMQKIDLV